MALYEMNGNGGISSSKVKTGELAKATNNNFEVTLNVPDDVIPLKVSYYGNTRRGSSTVYGFYIKLNYEDGSNEIISNINGESGSNGAWITTNGSAYIGYDIEKLKSITSITLYSRLGYQYSNQAIWISEWLEK